MNILDAIILGIVEGITEFLPISSTGHMILVSYLLGLKQNSFEKTFEIAIQLGAILAVVSIYREKLTRNIELWKKLIAAFIPTGIIGLALHHYVEELFNPFVVSIALIFWGAVFIVIELLYKEKEHHISEPEKISYLKAVMLGVFQSLAMIPGTSRSGATIIGGLLLGMKRVAATEFSFLLAIPTMFAATGFEIVKNFKDFTPEGGIALIVGFVTAFVFAYISVKWLLNFIKTHTFIPFGIYRIVVGFLFLKLFLL
ncbi:Undecaprenyl-diphosphatase [Desulfurobacterium thermolithotrophum DSM 11699]|uniref:Undecaprenyl-diphosphatase n=1 Tax=Desulfurobacterium thermolithotrophum (strain DSM 11699 / BSA) TaxID=868864 RepID=F0S1U4_DESTD|nr:undecaprenyl-diphosphate phosphatase [Desulfurobacterium thermolithotrophum]ADY72949.1 Undecaprenyl-diphosphatase [Desulfurobacterium thermolithotrophum DSM 11699]